MSAVVPQTSNAGLFGPSADTKMVVAKLKKLAVTENSILKRYGAVTGANYQDDYTTGMALIKLMPAINAYIAKLEALTAKDAKLQAGIDLLVQGWNKQAEGITLSIAAIDEQDYAKISQSNSMLSSARATLRRAGTALSPFVSK